MTTTVVIATILYTIVALSFIGNFIRLFVEAKQLKEKKQTPLIGKTVVTITLATLVESIVLFLLIKLVAILGVGGIIGIAITFAILYFTRTLTAYLVTWGLWAVFVQLAKKKELQKIKEDQQKESK